jgi:hypothetical protein
VSRRMTAEEVVDRCERMAGEASLLIRPAYVRAASLVRDSLVPQWQDEPDGDGWYWCEALEDDCPPQKIHGEPRLAINEHGQIRDAFPRSLEWLRWTISGWVPLVGRVAPCTGRP